MSLSSTCVGACFIHVIGFLDRKYFRNHNCARRLLLKIVNAALALVGICALAFSVYMVVTYKRSHVAAPAPTTAVYPW